MYFKKAVIGAALLALAAFSAIPVASAAASGAPRWKVEGAFLGAGVAKPIEGTSGTVDEVSGGFGISFTGCTVNGEAVGSAASVPAGHEATFRVCTGSKVIGSESTCSVHSPGREAGVVATNKLKGSLVYLTKGSAASVGLVFAPATGTEVLKLVVTGEKCTVAGEYPVTGEVVAKFVQAGETEVAEAELEFPTTPITSYFKSTEATSATSVSGLKIGASADKLSGKFKIKLTSKQKFGIFPG
jgi:hypothetical protein